jgi:large subunit ribosomal protein L16
MLMPKRVKYRKQQRGVMKGNTKGNSELSFGQYGLMALESVWITARQIEAIRLTLTRALKQGSKIWVRMFPDKPVTKKPAETRMGKWKGDVDHWVCVVKPGRVIMELEGISLEEAKEVLRLASHKLPIRTKFVSREMFN